MVAEIKRITIRDVAEQAGVSKQTVSRVINDRPDVAPATRVRVQQVIEQLGYHPDQNARSLKGSSLTLGCITPNLTDPIFSMIVEYAQSEARRLGFFVLTGSASTPLEVKPLLAEMLNRRVEGLLVINPRDDERYRYLNASARKNIPIVYLKNTSGEEHVSTVSMNDLKGGQMATQYLINMGHSRIATIMGPRNEECVGDRLSGYQQALNTAGIKFDPDLVVQGDWSPKSGSDAVKSLLRKKTGFTAVFAQNDRMATGAIRGLRSAGMSIPADISVIGYDDLPLASFYDPPLTTIKQPMDQFGLIGAQMLIEAVKNGQLTPRSVVLEPELIERSTCAPLRG
jgi:LacI family transcriptional regulator